MKYVDYIVVGGGISGSVLTYTLMKYGARVHVFDVPQANKSSILPLAPRREPPPRATRCGSGH